MIGQKSFAFYFCVFISIFSLRGNLLAQDLKQLIAPQAVVNCVSAQFSFTEGPAINRQGDIFFTDQPNNRIWKYSTDGKLSIFLENAGRSNGMYFDQDGNLIACADEKNQLWSIDPAGKVKVLLDNFEGHSFNGPNDVWVDKHGGLYFTDPFYQRKYNSRTKAEERGENVYYLSKGAKEAILVDSNLVRPNGIVGSSRKRNLYVSDIEERKIYKYRINKNGTLSDRKLFATHQSDGMTLDNKGNLYATGKDVAVFDKSGKLLGTIPVSSSWTANVSFAGKKRNILFITASKAIYTLKMRVKGVE
jgi:gluconolactonase